MHPNTNVTTATLAMLQAIREHAPRCHRCGADAQADDDAEPSPDHPWRWQHRACPAMPQAQAA